MLTPDGLMFVYKRVLTAPLEVVLFDENGVECSFPGYSRVVLNPNMWVIDSEMGGYKQTVVYALHAKQKTIVKSLKILDIESGVVVSQEKFDIPYIMQYKDDMIKVHTSIRLVSK